MKEKWKFERDQEQNLRGDLQTQKIITKLNRVIFERINASVS